MATNGEAKQISQIREYLFSNQLLDALHLIKSTIKEMTDWSILSRYQDIEMSYQYMVKYFSQGKPDTKRNTLYNQLIAKALLLTDDINIALLLPTSSAQYFGHMRRCTKRGQHAAPHYRAKLESYAEMPSLSGYDQLLHSYFDYIWTSPLWDATEREDIDKIVRNSDINIADQAYTVSAITLAIVQRFDPEKLSYLLLLTAHTEIQVSSRALVGVFIAIQLYSRYLPYFPALQAQLSLLQEQSGIEAQLSLLQSALTIAGETERINTKMSEEIIPTMLKNPKLSTSVTEINPDWDKWISSDEVKDKIVEMSELQSQGADIYMVTFSHLKRYPFFSEISNWFRPFRVDIPAIIDSSITSSDTSKHILDNSIFCNSDKYSFCLVFQQIPPSQRHLMLDEITSAALMEGTPQTPKPQEEYRTALRQYVQDLYRFFKLYQYKDEFADIFALDTNIHHHTPLWQAIGSYTSMHLFADFYLKRRYYQLALEILPQLEERATHSQLDYTYYQKLGYCYQKCNQTSAALDAYNIADLLSPSNLWTQEHILQCQIDMAQYNDAISTLQQLLKAKPSERKYALQLATCYIEVQQYAAAIKQLKRMEQQGDSADVWRLIAYASLLSNNLSQAVEYYDQLTTINPSPTAQDHLRAAHTYWIVGEVENAINSYRHSIKLEGWQEFITHFKQDLPLLNKNGVTKTDYSIMLDILRD